MEVNEELRRRGMWMQGRGPQYEQYLQQQNQWQMEKDAAHRQAFVQDMRALAMLSSGPQADLQAMERILQQRVDTLERHGGVVGGNESREALDVLRSGNPEAIGNLIADIAQTDQLNVAKGLIDPVTGPVANSQFGAGQQRYKDTKGNLFYGTTVRDPKTGSMETVLAPIGHNNAQDGALTQINEMGLTPEEMIQHRGDLKTTEVNRDQAARQAYEMFEKIGPIRANINRLGSVVTQIDKGAETGTIMKRLPSFRESAKALDQLQGQLGLDVVGNTTFGALSEKELQFAMDTALPLDMEGPQLKEWVLSKMDSQRKLATYLEDAAIFLSMGNTVSDWIQRQRELGQNYGAPLPPVNEKGWQLMEDAAGNKAYMGPNGEVEEVQ